MDALGTNCRSTDLVIVLPSLLGGGAERVASDLANHWVGSGRSVTLLTIDALHTPRYSLDDRIQLVGLGLMKRSRSPWQALRSNLVRVRRLRKTLVQIAPTCVLSFTDITNVVTLLACRSTRWCPIVCERSDPRHQVVGRVWNFLRHRMYRRAAAVVVQTEAVARWARAQGWNRRIVVIPNAAPLVQPRSPHEPTADPERPILLGLGRLSQEKGFDSAITAFARCAQRFPNWRLVLCGDGPDRVRLEALVRTLQLDDRVQFRGWIDDSQSVLRQSSLFVLPSQYEGFPNALLEAMACGLPCVAFDCESGPREIIRDTVDGILVPPGDVAALGDALSDLMGDSNRRTSLAARAREVVQRFPREGILQKWDQLLDGCHPVSRP